MFLDRKPLSDGDFAVETGLPADRHEPAIFVRRAIAKSCRIPPEAIYPDDLFEDLVDLMFFGWDQIEFLLALEAEIHFTVRLNSIEFPPFRRRVFFGWTTGAGTPASEWISQVAQQLPSAGSPGPPGQL